MADAADKLPWYAEGLSFTCLHCGHCCAGPLEGTVHVTAQEIDAIAEFLGLPSERMRQLYVRPAGGGWSLRERSDSRDCVFLAPTGQGQHECLVYAVRPVQCRTWPFWPDNLRSPATWNQAATRCAGINRGEHYGLDEIQARRDATRH